MCIFKKISNLFSYLKIPKNTVNNICDPCKFSYIEDGDDTFTFKCLIFEQGLGNDVTPRKCKECLQIFGKDQKLERY